MALPLGGCNPIFDIGGAFFPSWLLCMIVGIFGTMLVREILVQLGIDPYIFWKPLAYTGTFVSFATGMWLIFFST